MTGFIYIANEKIGEVNFFVIDKSMGAIGGNFIAYENYLKYQDKIQKFYLEKGIVNSDDFNFKIILSNNKKLNPKGGIGITDSKVFNEIYVESTGNNLLEI